LGLGNGDLAAQQLGQQGVAELGEGAGLLMERLLFLAE
jgi:hypothetical protein